MQELIDRVVADVGIDRTIAERSIGIILNFLSREGPADRVQALLARLPGHERLMSSTSSGGLLGGMGGLMGVGAQLMGLGLDMGQIQNVVRTLAAYCQEQGGGEDLKAVAAAIPGLAQYV